MNTRRIPSLKMECIMLFQSNPQSAHSLEALSKHLGKEEDELEPILEMLMKQGIIEQFHDEGKALYRYQEPEAASEFEMDP
ncbi:hypothetical protein [Salinicoccus roseus]|uniref:Uncharacterized protein n=1 Tax=Salinicoccus roseus TaxID=45670 RepID=A0A0C2HM38_9STAP|nr:hypothetical protein [Salinicoccus roseus]KIH70631.1 hypothetical protein SN16_07955 [Salinicoccus roseus]MDB0580733.1 hypothetical protein [Salinicoccus roseus]